jgi:hypothetical protein
MTLADAQAALARGRPIVLLRPPAVNRATELWELIAPPPAGRGTGPSTLIVCADHLVAEEWAGATPAGLRAHAVSGLARTSLILKAHALDILAGAPQELAALLARAALKLDQVTTVVVAWPEAFLAGEGAAALDTVLAEARAACRIVLSWNPAALGDFLERHARRALVEGTAAFDPAGTPLPPACQVRYCIVPTVRRAVAVRDALDALGATHPFIWDGGPVGPATPPASPDAVLCTQLPTREDLVALARLGVPLVFLTASQLPYLRSVATASPLALPSSADRARDRAEELRERVAARLAAGSVDAELALLDPLFERFDPAEVAAALLALGGKGATEQRGPAAAAPGVRPPVKVFVNVGKKHQAAAKDFVGALIHEAGLAKADIGRIEVREAFSLIEVAAGVAADAARRLSGSTIRGRRVLARLEREG